MGFLGAIIEQNMRLQGPEAKAKCMAAYFNHRELIDISVKRYEDIKGIDQDMLKKLARTGLIESAIKFEKEYGFDFETFATLYIFNHIWLNIINDDYITNFIVSDEQIKAEIKEFSDIHDTKPTANQLLGLFEQIYSIDPQSFSVKGTEKIMK